MGRSRRCSTDCSIPQQAESTKQLSTANSGLTNAPCEKLPDGRLGRASGGDDHAVPDGEFEGLTNASFEDSPDGQLDRASDGNDQAALGGKSEGLADSPSKNHKADCSTKHPTTTTKSALLDGRLEDRADFSFGKWAGCSSEHPTLTARAVLDDEFEGLTIYSFEQSSRRQGRSRARRRAGRINQQCRQEAIDGQLGRAFDGEDEAVLDGKFEGPTNVSFE